MKKEKLTASKNTNNANDVRSRNQLTRLPCRGCTVNCSYYYTCNARLWRMDDKVK